MCKAIYIHVFSVDKYIRLQVYKYLKGHHSLPSSLSEYQLFVVNLNLTKAAIPETKINIGYFVFQFPI